MGFVTVDPDAIQDANNQLQTLEGIIDDCRQRHQRHANDTHQALSDLAHRGISGLEHWQIEHIWQASPLGALGWEFHESLEIVKNVRARSEVIFSQLAQYHSQQLAMRMIELNEPILSHLDGAAGALSDLAGWLTFGNILGLIERPDTIFELLAGTTRSLEGEMEHLSSARAILDTLRQRALVLIEELEQPLERIFGAPHTTPHATPAKPTGVATPSGAGSATQSTHAAFAAGLVDSAKKMSQGLHPINTAYGYTYTSFLASDGTNTYPFDQNLANQVLSDGKWSWTDIECVAFVWMTYAQHLPDWKDKLLFANADHFWERYGLSDAKKLGWEEFPNGQPPQPGDIITMQVTNPQGALLYGHVAIVQGVTPLPPVNGHTRAQLHIYQANSPTPSATLTMTDGVIDPNQWDSKGHHYDFQGYVRYAGPTK